MRSPTEMSRRRARPPGRGRVVLIVVAVILFLLFTSMRQIAEFYTDYLWFDSVKYSSVWTRSLALKVELAVFFTLVFFVTLWVNLLIATKLAPTFRPVGPDDDLLNRYHEMVDRRSGSLRVVVAMIFALIVGASMSAQWEQWILFIQGGDFGTTDPQFGMDVSFFVFRLPFLLALVDWLFISQLIILLITASWHYLYGGIRLQSPFERVTPQVKAHLSVLVALLALTKAADYYLQRFQIVFSRRSGVVDGATATEVNAELPALTLLMIIALASFVLFLLNIRRRGWVLPVIAVGIWAFVQIVVGEIYPIAYERFVVVPEQSSREAVPIANNIKATRAAYGLDKVVTKDFTYTADSAAASASITQNPEVVRNIQLLDPAIVADSFERAQSLKDPLEFWNLATDRYPMEVPKSAGSTETEISPTQVVIADREVNIEAIPIKTWEGRTLSYTHGYGLALAAGSATEKGLPRYSVGGIPIGNLGVPSVDLNVVQPNVYYFNPDPGDATANNNSLTYSVVGTTASENNYIETDAPQAYSGEGGVQLDSFMRRMAFTLRFNDYNLVISQYITDQSRILYMRRALERVAEVAPFLSFDHDPYPVVIDGRVKFVIDAYTTSNFYPNAQQYYPPTAPTSGSVALGVLSSDLRNPTPFNYIRNSVKATVDAYTGEINLYIVDRDDPVALAYKAAFPDLFQEEGSIPLGLRPHLRYPQDLFRIQTDLWGRYRLDDPNNFYSRNNAWEPPGDPPDQPPQTTTQGGQTTTLNPAPVGKIATRQPPVYVINQLQGDAEPNYMIMRPFQPYSNDDSKPGLVAFMVARSDPENYGSLEVFSMPPGIAGVGDVYSAMTSDDTVTAAVTLLNQQGNGSRVRYGELLTVPINQSIVFVRALYVISEGSQQPPFVQNVIVYHNGTVIMKATLREALAELFKGSQPQTFEGTPPPSAGAGDPNGQTTTTTTPGTSPPGTVAPNTGGGDKTALTNDIARLLTEADAALDDGDLGRYQDLVEQATTKAQDLQRLTAGESPTATAPTTTTPTTTAPPGTSTTTAPSDTSTTAPPDQASSGTTAPAI